MMATDRVDYSEVFDCLPDAVCVVDTAGNIISSNAVFKSAILNCPNCGFVTDIIHSQHLEKYDMSIQKLRSNRQNGIREPLELGALKTLTISKEFQLFPVYRLIDWSISSLSGDLFIVSGRNQKGCGDRTGFGSIGSACLNDVSDAACNKIDKLKPEKPHPYDDMTIELIDFFQNAPIALHWLSGTGTILWANEAELKSFGYTAEEYVGHSITEFLMPGEDVHLQEVFGNLAAGRTIHDAPFRFRAKNGDVKYVIVDSNVNFNEDGSFRHTRCFIRNDADRRVKEEILIASNRIMRKEAEAKSTFIRHVFHEMRTPLHVLSTFLSSFNPTVEDFEEMKYHTDSTLGMVDDLTFATTYEAGKLPPMSARPIHLPSLIYQVIDAVNTVEQKGGRAVEIRIKLNGFTTETETILADPCLSRVVYSLLTNAVRYSPAKGHHIDFIVNCKPDVTSISTSISTSASTSIMKGQKRSLETSLEETEESSKYLKHIDGKMISTMSTVSTQSIGNYTFSFENTTIVPIDLKLIRNYFTYYYHFDSNSRNELSVEEETDNLNSFLDTSGIDRKTIKYPIIPSSGFNIGKQTHNNFHVSNSSCYKDLASTKGLGLGLYTAHNMLALMGGELQCHATNNSTAIFSFSLSLPSSDETVERYKPMKLNTPMSVMKNSDFIPSTSTSTSLFNSISTSLPSKESFSLITETISNSNSNSNSIATTTDKNIPLIMNPDVKTINRKQMRILVVDDSSMCQKVLVKSLKGLEFDTDVASNGKEACDKLQDIPCKFDAVLMDLRMPIMDGLAAIRYCRQVLKLEKLPIISLTAEIGTAIREEAFNAGTTHFMNKPAKGSEIISLLRSLIVESASITVS